MVFVGSLLLGKYAIYINSFIPICFLLPGNSIWLLSTATFTHINFRRLFNAKTILVEEYHWYYLTHSRRDNGVHTFPNCISPNVSVIARLEFKFAYFDAALRQFSYYAKESSLYHFGNNNNNNNNNNKVKLATLVAGDPKAPFSIATIPRCRRGRYSIPWIAPLYPYNAEC